jgi:hypothetical protein
MGKAGTKKLAIASLLSIVAGSAWAEDFHTYTNPFAGSMSAGIEGRPFHTYTNPFTGSVSGDR